MWILILFSRGNRCKCLRSKQLHLLTMIFRERLVASHVGSAVSMGGSLRVLRWLTLPCQHSSQQYKLSQISKPEPIIIAAEMARPSESAGNHTSIIQISPFLTKLPPDKFLFISSLLKDISQIDANT